VHQEYVSSLVTFGEFRVFIATQAGDDGTRTPYIVHAIRTWWTDKNSKSFDDTTLSKPENLGYHYSAACVTREDVWHEYPSLDYAKLVSFALRTYRNLQSLEAIGFQSLDVGARLDIGVAPDGTQFFVNELTRWYGAHHFALHTQSQPGDEICRAYAKAFAETSAAKQVEAHLSRNVAQGDSALVRDKANVNVPADASTRAPRASPKKRKRQH
jgi:hypothetical protein